MASSDTHQTIVSDHQSSTPDDHQKISEATETNKQENVPPTKPDGKEDKKEKPKEDNSSELEITVTKSEETSDNKKTEVPVVAEFENVVPAEINVKHDANSVSEEPLDKPAKKLSEEKVAIATSSEVKPAAETVVQEQKPTVETVVQEEKPAIEAVKNVEEEKPAVEAAENSPDEKPATEAIENIQDVKPAIEIVKEDKMAVEETEKLQTATDAVESPHESDKFAVEKPAIEAIENVQDLKPAVEAAETLAEEKPTVEETEKLPKEEPAAANVQEEKPAIEKVDNQIKEKEPVKKTDENKPKDNAAIEQVEEKTETENVDTISSTEAVSRSVKPQEVSIEEIVDEVEEKPQEPSRVIVEEVVEKSEAKLQENVEGEVKKDEGAKLAAIQSSPATNEQAQADIKEVAKGSPVSGVVEKVDDDKNREETTVKEEKNVKSEEVTEEPIPSVEKSLEGEQGLIKKNVDLPSAVETKNDDKDVVEAEKVSVKAGAGAEAENIILEGRKETVDDKKTDPPTKEAVETKTSKEVPAKPPQKSSVNLLSKVKQSFGKMKKAIIGKNPSSKTLQSEDKGDEKVN